MTIPVLKQTLQQYPQLRILLVTQQQFKPLCTGIERLDFFGADLKGRHAGVIGIFRLFMDIRKGATVHVVADLHGVLRAFLLTLLFKVSGASAAHINKGRFQKWQLTRRWLKVVNPLPTTFDRYRVVLAKLGFATVSDALQEQTSITLRASTPANGPFSIGVAPFAKHPEKMLPLSKLLDTITALQEQIPCTIYLFGAPGHEAEILNEWTSKYPQLINMAVGHTLEEELETMKQLDLLIAMDSANMHLASLFSVPVISIWGATHPYAGFLGWGQSMELVIQAELPCRPCSVYGNKKCYRGDWACLNAIQPTEIVQKVRSYLCQA